MGKKRISNYGPDVFFRRIRLIIRNTFICVWSSFLIGLFGGLIYLTFMMPSGSWSSIPKYIKHLVRWHLNDNQKSAQYVLDLREFYLRHTDTYQDSLDVGIWVGVVSIFALGFFFWKVGRRNQENSHLRGSEVITPRQLQKEMKRTNRFGFQNGYTIGKAALRVWEEFVWRGIAIVGRPGTGKSNLIRQMMKQDLKRNAKWFIIDINGDYWRKFGRPGKDKILSLRYKESELWDIKGEDVVPSLLSSYLVEKSPTGPSFWWKGGRGVLTPLIEHSKDNDDFKNKIAQSDGNILKLLKDNDELVSKVLGKEGSTQSAGILGNTVLDFSFIKDLGYWPKKAGKTKPFSITEWATDKNDTSWVYVVVRDDELEEIKPLMACWFNLAINGCFRRDEEAATKGEYPSIRIGLDELKSLGKLEEVEKAGERLRKYRCSLVIGYQNNAQLEATYGKPGAENLKDVLQFKVIYSVGEPKAQKELSELLGDQEIEEMNASVSYGRKDTDAHSESHRITKRWIVLPSEIGKLEDGDCFVKIGSFDPIKLHIPYIHYSNVNPPLEWELPPRKPAPIVGATKADTQPNLTKNKSDSQVTREADQEVENEIDPREQLKKFNDQIEVEF